MIKPISIDENLERVEHLVDRQMYRHDGVPMFSWIEISPIDMCNRACSFCPRVDPDVAPNQTLVMPSTLYRKMAAELKDLDYRGTVMLAGFGEPMMNRDIHRMAAEFGAVCNTEITTNGDLLSPRTIGDLIDAGIGKIIVSLYDGPEQVERFARMFADAGVPESRFLLRDRWHDSASGFGVKLTNRAGTVAIGNQPAVDCKQPCYYPHYSMNVDWNGDVFLCTQDWNRRVKSGNLMLQGFMDVWNSAMLRRYRTHLAAGNRDVGPCNQCNANGTLHGSMHVGAWSDYYRTRGG